jgi:oligogalacturonide lyase
MRGTNYGGEQIEMADQATGASIIQITSAPVPSQGFYFEYPSFNAANDTLFFYTQRIGMRGAPWDLCRATPDGSNLVQLSDEEYPLEYAYPDPNDPHAIYGVRENALIRLDIDTCEEVEIGRCPDVGNLHGGTMDGTGKWFFSIGTLPGGGGRLRDSDTAIVRFRTDGSEVATLGRNHARAHLTCNHTGTLLHFRHAWSGPDALAVCDINGENMRRIGFQEFAHRTWLGTTDRLQGPLLPPGHGIVQVGLTDEEPTPICAGPYFWHSASTKDGQWIVSDTNWPEQGIMLVHVESGRYAPVAQHRGTPGDGQGGHPHPSFDRDGSRVIYTSNRGGLSQVYVAEIPDTLRRELSTGELTNRLRFRC